MTTVGDNENGCAWKFRLAKKNKVHQVESHMHHSLTGWCAPLDLQEIFFKNCTYPSMYSLALPLLEKLHHILYSVHHSSNSALYINNIATN